MSDYEIYLHQKTAKMKRKNEFKKEFEKNKLELATFLSFMLGLGFLFSLVKFNLTNLI